MTVPGLSCQKQAAGLALDIIYWRTRQSRALPDVRARQASGGNSDYLPFDLLALALWVKADAATDLTAAGVRGLLNNLAAVDATRAEVCSFVGFLEDMGFSLSVRGKRVDGNPVLLIPARDGSGKQLHLTRM